MQWKHVNAINFLLKCLFTWKITNSLEYACYYNAKNFDENEDMVQTN